MTTCYSYCNGSRELIAAFTLHVDLIVVAAAEELALPIAAASVLPHIVIVTATISAADVKSDARTVMKIMEVVEFMKAVMAAASVGRCHGGS